ncbi:MAG: hypothetical protein PWP09_1316, partial [Thermotogota bacterium]|nr:hypothetical protein [Thermotogota bacterium]
MAFCYFTAIILRYPKVNPTHLGEEKFANLNDKVFFILEHPCESFPAFRKVILKKIIDEGKEPYMRISERISDIFFTTSPPCFCYTRKNSN